MAIVNEENLLVPYRGVVDGKIYDVVYGRQRIRRLPIIPQKVHQTHAAKLHLETFRMIRAHIAAHGTAILHSFDKGEKRDGQNNYFSANYVPLKKALEHLAERYWQRWLACGDRAEKATLQEIEAAITVYASSHPTEITIVNIKGYRTATLQGRWPYPFYMFATKGTAVEVK